MKYTHFIKEEGEMYRYINFIRYTNRLPRNQPERQRN